MSENIYHLTSENEDKDLLQEKNLDNNVPGYGVEFDPDEAEQMGAMEDDALTLEDVIESAADMATDDNQK